MGSYQIPEGNTMTNERTPTVIFGLDGACLDLIRPWLDDGRLPTLNRLIETGGATDLESTVPATTPPGWTSLTTGVNPGKHGIFGFYTRQPGTFETTPVTDRHVHARRLWDYLDIHDDTAVVVNVPVTHPARVINGCLIPGYLAPDEPSTFPSDIISKVGMEGYRIYAPSETASVSDEQLLEEWLELTKSRAELTQRLVDEFDPDLVFLEFQKTDGAVHKFGMGAHVRRIYEVVDTCMAEVLESIEGEPNVFVVSDHGIGQEKRWAVALNTWLSHTGYAETRIGPADRDQWLEQARENRSIKGSPRDSNATTDPSSSSSLSRSYGERLVRGVLGLVGRVGVTKQDFERLLSRLGLYERAIAWLPEGIGSGLRTEVIDREQSLAFYEAMGFSGVDVGVIINDERFYPDGKVKVDRYDEIREDLMDALRELRGPDGQRAFETLRPREHVYTGDRVDMAPDIVLEQSADYVIGSQEPRGQTFIPADGRIDHTRTGLLIAAGPDVREDWELAMSPSILDITPTVLHLREVPLSDRFDGEVLMDIFEEERSPRFDTYEPFEPEDPSGTEADEEELLAERLRDLGYLG